MIRTFGPLDLSDTRALLSDADGTLFASEEPAFEASAEVTNAFLASMGVDVRLTPQELRRATTGLPFRATAVDLCVAYGVPVEEGLRPGGATGTPPPLEKGHSGATLTRDVLERWTVEERERVSAYLGSVLRPDRAVIDALTALDRHLALAIVTNSATERLDACLAATGLAPLFPPEQRFSAEDSLPEPTSKPDPAVYALAGERLDCRSGRGLVVEDSVPGAQAAVAAGFQTIGLVGFLPAEERPERIDGLRRAGASVVVSTWAELAALVLPGVTQSARVG